MQKPLLLIFRGILPGRIQAWDLFILDNFHPTKIFVCGGVQFSMIFAICLSKFQYFLQPWGQFTMIFGPM